MVKIVPHNEVATARAHALANAVMYIAPLAMAETKIAQHGVLDQVA